MESNTTTSLAVAGTGLGLILVLTLSSLSTAAGTIFSRKKKSASTTIYKDEDGVSTEECMSKYSTAIPKYFLAVFSLSGLGISIVLVVHTIIDKDGNFRIGECSNMAGWALIAGQLALLFLSEKPTHIYTLGIRTSLSCICLLAVILTQEALRVQRRGENSKTILALRIAEIVAIVFIGLAGSLLQRRPVVFTETGRAVDGQHTASALSKCSFSWAGSILDTAMKKGGLKLNDLPRPDHHTRSTELAESWYRAKHTGRLWVDIFLAHRSSFVFQWILTVASGLGSVAPQFMILNILRMLEERDAGRLVTSEAWIWVIALGLSQVVLSWLDSWLFWLTLSQIVTPVQAELSSLIFRKSMRLKDVRIDTAIQKVAATGASESVDPPETNTDAEPGTEAVPEPPKNHNGKEDGEKEKTGERSSQSAINLIGVDVDRVVNFANLNRHILGSLSKIAVCFWLLVEIIGWKAFGAGLLSMLIIMPINTFFSRKYAAAQRKIMEVSDRKEAAVSEALRGVRQIKFSALEKRWTTNLDAIRSRELDSLWAVFVSETALLFCWISSPMIFSIVALATYSIDEQLTPHVAFTVIGVFNTLQITLAVIPDILTMLMKARLSVKRIQKYLEAPEVDSLLKSKPSSIFFEDACLSFPSNLPMADGDQRFVLRNVNISFPEKEISIVCGKTGSGKSLLLSAILKEADIISGSVNVPCAPSVELRQDDTANEVNWILPLAIAFAAQNPWIENMTIKENILFGLPFDAARYEKTIESCALRKDIDALPDGEHTEIGANGINLSGGQKWRLSFARALYSRAGILVLDDIFSAVDSHVGRHILQEGLAGELGVGRTRILATHHVALCKPKSKYLVELGEGTVQTAGLLSELNDDGTLAKVVVSDNAYTAKIDHNQSMTSIDPEGSDNKKIAEPLDLVDTAANARKFVEEESKKEGRVHSKVYRHYLRSSGGWPFWLFALVVFLSEEGLTLGRSWWLRLWTGANEKGTVSSMTTTTFKCPQSSSEPNTSQNHEDLMYWLGGYVAISLANLFVSTFAYFYIFCGSIKASRNLFTRMLHTVLHAPLRWHDTVPLGRILNRFAADFSIVDSKLGSSLSDGASAFLKLLGIVLAGFFVSPYVVIVALVFAAISTLITRKFLVGAREAKRLDAVARSPIFSQFESSLSGVTTIRAFGKTERYIRLMSALIDDHTTTSWHLWLFNRWFAWRMSIIGAVFSTTVAALILSTPGIDAALSGFGLLFALEYSSAITSTIRSYTNVELDMNAAERIVEYITLPTESQSGVRPPASWPSVGRLEVSDLSVTYAPDLPCVLKHLTFSIEPNQRVGIVGRTGAGKSSLTLALFRFLEAKTGGIYIDGLDISKVRLEDLRSRLAIIPQDPVLFSGTIRSNLDPFEERSDEELMDALRRVRLLPSSSSAASESPTTPISTTLSSGSSSAIHSLSEKPTRKNPFCSLHSQISPSGLNLSQGQRQLLCLARANITRSKIMILDEATSAVDMATDALIQRSIREEFADSTLIVIAHRLSTIADFDKILVLDQGEVREFGSPRELLKVDGGLFKGMVCESGQRQELEHLILGKAW